MPFRRWNISLASPGLRACDHAWLRHGDMPRKSTRRRGELMLCVGFVSQSPVTVASSAMTDSSFGARSPSASITASVGAW